MSPKLTDEEKEQLKMARRSSMRIEETWSLYTMYLSQDKRPEEALEKAQEAVAVWAEWMDHNQIDPPEIHHPDFAEQMAEASKAFAQSLMPMDPSKLFARSLGVDAEFVASTEPESPATGLSETSTEQETGTSQKETGPQKES